MIKKESWVDCIRPGVQRFGNIKHIIYFMVIKKEKQILHILFYECLSNDQFVKTLL